MRKKNEYLTTAQKVKLEKRRKFAADFLKVYPPCFVVTGLVTLFAIFMTGDFYDAFTPERGAATAGVFVIHEVLAGFLIASAHASAEDARFPMREVLLSFLMTIITYIVCLATAKFLNVFALPVCLAALVLTVLSNRRTSSITSLVIVAMLLVSFIRGENYPDAMLPEVILSVVGNFAAALAVNMLVDKHLARLPFILVSFAASALGMLVVFAGTLVMGDIGKLKAPVYFSENQTGYNPHDELIPEVSVSMITSHTVFGEILAKQYRLPPEIVAVCREHHGTSPVGYFYRKALNLTEEGDLSVSNYTYPGPKPQTKIAAIVMIADTVEAACRAYMPDTQEGFVERVNKLVDEKLQLGQFDECPITMKDLSVIKTTIIETLPQVQHGRVSYEKKKA